MYDAKSKVVQCPICGTVFFIRYTPDWQFKIKDGKGRGATKWFCKYSCKRKYEAMVKAEREKRKAARKYPAASEERKKRQSESMRKKYADGLMPGRPPMKKPGIWEEIRPKLLSGEITTRIAAEKLGVSQTTVLRWKREAG